MVFLPLFNALAVVFGAFSSFSLSSFVVGVVFGFVVAGVFSWWRRNIAVHDDWSRPRKGVFTMGGWYHSLFMTAQAGVISYALLMIRNGWLWLPLAGFSLLVCVRAFSLFKK